MKRAEPVRTLPTVPRVEDAGLASARAAATSPSSSELRPLIVATLALCLLLFAAAAVPVRYVPWRRAAYFIHERHVDFTSFGIVLLVAAAFAILLTRGG